VSPRTVLLEPLPDLSAFSEPGLFSLYRAILRELKGRGVTRTDNAPVGDYAEYLVATSLGGQLAPNSEKPWDVLASDGEKLQVKARVVSDPAEPGQLQLSRRIFRELPAARERQGLARPPRQASAAVSVPHLATAAVSWAVVQSVRGSAGWRSSVPPGCRAVNRRALSSACFTWPELRPQRADQRK
jgi:hypothetical protein